MCRLAEQFGQGEHQRDNRDQEADLLVSAGVAFVMLVVVAVNVMSVAHCAMVLD